MQRQEESQSVKKIKDELFSYQKIREVEPDLQSYLKTPIFQRGKKKFIRDNEQTERLKIFKRQSMGSMKWIFKTSLKVVSPRIYSSKDAFNKETTLSKLKSFTRASEVNLKKEISLFEDKKALIKDLLLKNEAAKLANIALKKGLLSCDAKRNNILFMINKCKTIDQQILESEDESQKLKALMTEQSIKFQNLQKEIRLLRETTIMVAQASERVQKDIQEILPAIQTYKNEIKELSMTKLPNHKQVISCMFSIGILNEQLYIIELENDVKRSLLSDSTKVLKGEKDLKIKELQTRNIFQKISENQMNRLITIDCQSSEILVFKILTVVYMHCRSLMLNNISTLMKKTSYFAQEFKQLYMYQNFERYLSNLIERYKGNYDFEKNFNSSRDSVQISSKSIIKIAIISNEKNIDYLKWILESFQEKKKAHALKLDNTTLEFHLFTFEQLILKQAEGKNLQEYIGSNTIIRLVLHNFNQEVFWK